MNFEHEIERALRRDRPAPGLASRVLTKIEAAPPRRAHARWQAVAATLMILITGGGWAVHHEIERRAGERARDQALLALRIAGAKVRYAQEQVRSIGTHSNEVISDQ